MKERRLTKIKVSLVALLVAIFMSLPVLADGVNNQYTPIPGTTTKLKKYLVVRKGETNPAVKFEFEVNKFYMIFLIL